MRLFHVDHETICLEPPLPFLLPLTSVSDQGILTTAAKSPGLLDYIVKQATLINHQTVAARRNKLFVVVIHLHLGPIPATPSAEQVQPRQH